MGEEYKIKQLQQEIEKRGKEIVVLKATIGVITKRAERLQQEIDKVPGLLVYGNWDYKRCLFCKGKRKHKPGCIKADE